MESEQQSTGLGDSFVRFKVFFRKLFEEPSSPEELSFHKNLIAYFEIRCGKI